MSQPVIVLVTLVALGSVAALGFSRAKRDDPAKSDASSVQSAARAPGSSSEASAHATEQTSDGSSRATPSQDLGPGEQASPERVARWIADTQHIDARTRAAAIVALAGAPKSQAVPALQRVLAVGEAQVDRQIALRSLQVLALADGDSDGAIRDVVRHAVYHGDDEGVTQSAQAVLDDIESEFAERAAAR